MSVPTGCTAKSLDGSLASPPQAGGAAMGVELPSGRFPAGGAGGSLEDGHIPLRWSRTNGEERRESASFPEVASPGRGPATKEAPRPGAQAPPTRGRPASGRNTSAPNKYVEEEHAGP